MTITEILKHAYIIAAFVLAIIFLIEIKQSKQESLPVKTDTSYVKHVYEYKEPPNIQPVKVIIQQQPDKQRRIEAEKKDIVEGVKIQGDKVNVITIDTSGNVKKKEYDITDSKDTTINSEGVNVKKRTRAGKVLRKTADIGLKAIGVIAIIYTIIKSTK